MPSKSKKTKATFKNITTLNGVSQFKLMKGRRSVLWSLAMAGNMVLTMLFIVVITKRYRDDQIVTMISANCLVSEVPFPAVSICNLNMVSLRETSVITKILKYYDVTQEEMEMFYESLQNLKDFYNIDGKNKNLTKIVATLKNHYFTMDTVMEEVHQKCDKLLVYCTFNGKVKNCNDFFRLIKTYEGFCCAFNYAALKDSKGPQWSKDEDIEYYEDPSAADVNPNEGIITTSQSGRGSGLSVIFNVEPSDYPSWSPVPFHAAKILLSDPNDFPETTVIYKYISIGNSMEITVEPRVFQCESDVRRVDPLKRGCWFHDEVQLENTDRYSYETCKTECRMRNYLKHCGCIPYKYPREAWLQIPDTFYRKNTLSETAVRVCEFEDIQCLSDVRVYKTQDWTPCEPLCLPECRDKKYSITSDTTPLLHEVLTFNITEGHNTSDLAALQVYFGKSTSNCYKLTLLMDLNYFIVTYGGVFSLSFGASILTVFEILFLSVAAIVNICKKAIWK